MTPTEKHKRAARARALLDDLEDAENIIERGSFQTVLDHLANAEREAMKRAQNALCEVIFHDERDAGLAIDAVVSLRLSQAGEG